MAISKNTRTTALKAGRPPLSKTNGKPLNEGNSSSRNNINARRKSSKATRKLINTHHQLHKARAAALASNNHDLITHIDEQIKQLGGLEAYQQASLTGQDKDRGGDSSEKLVEWLRKYDLVGSFIKAEGLRVLEVGALSSRNAISGMMGKGVAEVKRIDLHSQEPGRIEEIDFMDFPLPDTETEKHDVVSLSLVLNYVPEAAGRGDMLRRTTKLLRERKHEPRMSGRESSGDRELPLPCLFLVLPLSCLRNSRYMTHDHLVAIMRHLGYEEIERHDSTKLAYMLFKWHGKNAISTDEPRIFKKVEINPGKTRNNFAIILDAS